MCNDPRAVDTIIDVPIVGLKLRHALIFSTFEELRGGESFHIVTDHDPTSLFYRLGEEYPGIFDWVYEKRGPDIWKIRVDRLVP